jgi:hypothetical protein
MCVLVRSWNLLAAPYGHDLSARLALSSVTGGQLETIPDYDEIRTCADGFISSPQAAKRRENTNTQVLQRQLVWRKQSEAYMPGFSHVARAALPGLMLELNWMSLSRGRDF